MFGELWVYLFFALLLTGFASRAEILVIIGAIGLLLAGGSWLWSWLSLERLTYHRTLSRHRVFIGEAVELTATLTNAKGIPLSRVRVEDTIPSEVEVLSRAVQPTAHGKLSRLTRVTSVGPYERVRWSYQVRGTQRGFYRLGPATLGAGDIFGFFQRRQHAAEEEYLLVFPKPVPLPDLGIPSRRVLGEHPAVEKLYQDPARLAGVRDYRPGDPVKYIDWKATAHRGDLQVRVFEPGASPLVTIFLNIDTIGAYWGGYIPKNFERAVTVAASLAQETLALGLPVGFYTNGLSVLYDRPMNVSPGRHPQQLPLIFEALAMVSPVVMTPIEEKLWDQMRKLPLGATVVLVTAVLPIDLAKTLEALARQRRSPIVLWVADENPEHLPEGVVYRDLGPYLKELETDASVAV